MTEDGREFATDSRTPDVSAAGRFVVFFTSAPLSADDANTLRDAFIYDRQLRTIEKVSVNSLGQHANRSSGLPSVSADGRFVAFESQATNLDPRATNFQDQIYVRDRLLRITTVVSLNATGQAGNSFSLLNEISDDGRIVAFASNASNLVPGDTNGLMDAFVHDRLTGELRRVSVSSSGVEANRRTGRVALSADGRFVAFESDANNLTPEAIGGVFVHDLLTRTTSFVASGSAPALSADGRFVAYGTFGLTGPDVRIEILDRNTGTRIVASVGGNGEPPNGLSKLPRLSADGRFVAFLSFASNLVPGDTNGGGDWFVRDLRGGVTTRVSVTSDGAQADGSNAGSPPGLSADGRVVAFESPSRNLVPGDLNGETDIFVREITAGPADDDSLGASFGDGTVGAYVDDPVNTFSGNLTARVVDIALPGRGPPLAFDRAYNGRDRRAGLLGPGWTTSLEIAAAPRGPDVVVTRAHGRRDVYTRSGSGYSPPQGVFDELSDRAGGGWLLRTTDQFVLTFATSGALDRMVDRNDNALVFERGADGRVVRLVGPGGRALTFSYDSSGRLAQVADPLGRRTTYGFDAEGRLSTVTDASGAVTRYGYDGAGRLATVTDPLGNVVLTNTYDRDGRVVEQRDAVGATSRYVYEPAARVTTLVGRRGATTAVAHDESGRVIALTDATGGLVTYAYDVRGSLASFRDRNGNLWQFASDERGNRTGVTDPAGATASFTYDARNDLLTRSDPLGNTWRYAYDARGNLARVTDPEGGTTSMEVDAAGQPVRITDADGVAVAYAYDAAGNVVSVTTAAGTATTVYDAAGRALRRTDANGHATAFAYDPLGRLTAVTDPLGQASALAYDAAGNLTQTTDRRGGRTVFAHDAASRLVRITDALGGVSAFAHDAAGNRTGISDPAGKTIHFEYDALERLASVTDAEGGTSRFAYDPSGNLVRITDPRGGVASNTFNFRNQRERATDRSGAATTFAYDAAGRLTSTTDPAGATTRFAYDRAGRYTSTTDAAGGVSALAYTGAGRLASSTDPRGGRTAFSYDASGRLSTLADALGGVTRYAYHAVGNRLSRTDALGRATRYEFDQADRLAVLADAAGGLTRFTYDAEGALTILTDAAGAQTRYAYDALGQLVGVTDALGGVTRYELEPRGLLSRLVDANGNARSYAYDGSRRLVRETDGLGRARVYAYDRSGNLASATDPKGQTTRYAYDAEDRLVEVARADGELVRYARDARGLRTAMTDPRGATAYAYDALRRLTSVTDPAGRRVGYAYDPSGNRTRLAYPDGREAAFAHDALDRLTAVTDLAGGVHRYAYDAVGNMVAGTLASGVSTSASYDALDRPTALMHLDGRGKTAAAFTYAYDAVGNVVRETADGARDLKDDRAYAYDALRRLVSVTDRGKKASAFGYDSVGNRISVSRDGKLEEQATFDAADQLTALGRADGKLESAFSYDANGNLTERKTRSHTSAFAYDAADRLVFTREPGKETRFRYSGDGDLAREERGAGGPRPARSLDYTLDVAGPLSQVLVASDGADAASFLYGLGRLGAFAGSDTRFYASDIRQSPRLLLDERGEVAGARGFDAWGVPDPNTSAANETGPAALIALFGFVGERQDAHSGLLHLRARWYDPSLGRFLTRDPFPGVRSDPRTAHPYAYALNNPASFVDRTGRSATSLFDGAAGYSYDATALYANPLAQPPVGPRRQPNAAQRVFYFLADTSRTTGDFLAETAGPALRQGAYDVASAWATTEENLNSGDPGRQANALGSIFVNTAGTVAGAIVVRVAALVGLGALAQRFQAVRAPPPVVAPARLPVPLSVHRPIVNPVPATREFARVLTPEQVQRLQAGEPVALSPRAGAPYAFVTRADALPRGAPVPEIADLAGVSERNVGGVVRFRLDAVTGIATPIRSEAPGFIGRGVTSGGIPEFVVENRLVSDFVFDLEVLTHATAGIAR